MTTADNAPMGAYGVTLVPIVRRRGMAYPSCDARERLHDDGSVVPGSRFEWCNRSGRFEWGEQHVCAMHAEKLTTKRRVGGIAPNGKWGGCLVHIDCTHSIDDAEWESKWTLRAPDTEEAADAAG